MEDYQDLRRGRHCVSALKVHLVFVTKYRRGALDAKALEWRQGHFAKVCEQMEARLFACDGEDDHVHLLVGYPPKLAIAALVKALKGTSSLLLRKEMPHVANRHWQRAWWTPSNFAASAGGAPLAMPRQCVERQRTSSPARTAGFPARSALMTCGAANGQTDG